MSSRIRGIRERKGKAVRQEKIEVADKKGIIRSLLKELLI
jgi:hypothetical protein